MIGIDDEILQINRLQEGKQLGKQSNDTDALSGQDVLFSKLEKVQANQQHLKKMVGSISSNNQRKDSPGAFSPVGSSSVKIPKFVAQREKLDKGKEQIGVVNGNLKNENAVLNDLYHDLRKEKEEISTGMKRIKIQIRQLKAEYPNKPRPPSIASTLKGMEKNLKTHKERLEKVFETEKALYHEPDEEFVHSDHSLNGLEPSTPKKNVRDGSKAIPSQSQEKLKLASEINDLARRLRKMDGGETLLNKIEARSAKKEKESSFNFFGMCCGGGN